MRRLTALAIALVSLAAVVAGSACGSTESEEPAFIPAAQVMERFRARTGTKLLRRTAVPDAAWEQLNPGLNPSPAVQDRYGTFVIYVAKPGRDEAVGSLLRDKETKESLQADDQGIYWEKDDLSGTWVANKRYGANVVLAWFSSEAEPLTDSRFERLDRILAGLRGSSVG